eukprot:3384044-Amphidinium_carterae.1
MLVGYSGLLSMQFLLSQRTEHSLALPLLNERWSSYDSVIHDKDKENNAHSSGPRKPLKR